MMILTGLTYIFLRSKLYLEIKIKEKKKWFNITLCNENELH